MIAFKQITRNGPTPNFKNLRNNSVIDNDLFLRQKMVITNKQLLQDGLLETNNKHTRQAKQSKNSNLTRLFGNRPRLGSEHSNHSRSPSDQFNLSINKKISPQRQNTKRSLRGSQMGEFGMSDETAEECSGWKLVEAHFRDGMVYCNVPEVNIENGELIMFDKQGVMSMIKSNDFNSGGKKLLDEVTQWLQKKTKQAKRDAKGKFESLAEASGDSTIKEIKGMFNCSTKSKGKQQRDKNKEVLGFDLSLNCKKSIDERVMEINGRADQKSPRTKSRRSTAFSTSGSTCV